MHSLNFDKRKSGLALIGDIPWGSHFCQFYDTGKDLLDILVPYFAAGLENNEFCLWVTPEVFSPEDAREALNGSVNCFAQYENNGQVKIIPYSSWRAGSGRSGMAIISKLDKAIASGFDGLRLACPAYSDREKAESFTYAIDAISRHNVIAAFTYPRDKFGAIGLMEVVKNHRFALVHNVGKWEVIESSEARIVRDALKRSEEKLHSLFKNMSEGFAYFRIVLDEGKPCNFIFLETNAAFEKLTGLSGKKIMGKLATEVFSTIRDSQTDWIGKFGAVALTGKPLHFESYFEPLGRWYAVSAFSPHKGYFGVTFSDISDRKKAEENIIALNEELKRNIDKLSATNNDLETFCYSVSHDLRAPLRSIAGFVELMKKRTDGHLDEKSHHYLEVISSSTKQMDQLITDLLAFSRTGRTEMKGELTNCRTLVQDAIRDLTSETKERNITWDIRDLPQVFGDPILLRAALVNLISNALKYTRPRELALIEIGCIDRENEYIFHVRDNGVGFDIKYRDKMFDLFQRLHRSDEFEGTGVGLANVQKIIQRHGGRVWADGEVNKGACFFFSIPKANLPL